MPFSPHLRPPEYRKHIVYSIAILGVIQGLRLFVTERVALQLLDTYLLFQLAFQSLHS
jgi:hypothetical protein